MNRRPDVRLAVPSRRRTTSGCSYYSDVLFVVATQPAHRLVAFVAPLGSVVENRVESHQELGAAGVAGIAVVDGVTLAGERVEAVPLGEIALEIRAPRTLVPGRGQRQVLTDRRLFLQ